MGLIDMFEDDKKKLSLFQNKMRIGITLLYGHDSCVKIFEIYTNSLQKQMRNKQLIILLTGPPLSRFKTKSSRAFEP